MPFVFFIVFAFVLRLIECVIRLALGAQGLELSWTELIEPFYRRYWPNTAPIWFLLSLFWVNIIFYALQRWVRPLWGLLVATMAISVVGYLLGFNKIELPLMLDTSFVALPYFVLGWGINRLGMVRPHRFDRWGVVCLLVVLIPIYFFSEFTNLHFQVLPSYWKLYCLPFIAILALFWACKPLPRIPVLCHFGRYSLIILGTHQVIFLPLRFLFIHYGMQPGVTLTLIVFALTMIIEWPMIWILKTYFPRFTAQKPFFNADGWRI